MRVQLRIALLAIISQGTLVVRFIMDMVTRLLIARLVAIQLFLAVGYFINMLLEFVILVLPLRIVFSQIMKIMLFILVRTFSFLKEHAECFRQGCLNQW